MQSELVASFDWERVQIEDRLARLVDGRLVIAWHGLLAQGEAMIGRYACPCCGFLTLAQEPPGTYAVCPVCWWEDDDVQFRDPSYSSGANMVSLRQARVNFLATGASEERFLSCVRGPTLEEQTPND